MIVLHEQMKNEAEVVKVEIENVYRIPVRVFESDLTPFLQEIAEVADGYSNDPNADQLAKEYQDKAVLLLTKLDVFGCDDVFSPFSKDDQWAFAGTSEDGTYHLVSTARLNANHDLYLRRLRLLAIHELGHKLVANQEHYKEAHWVNAETGRRCCLGPHCDANHCVMYEVVDIETPQPERGYLELGCGDRRYDAGLDDHLERVGAGWFCCRCKPNICVPLPYLAT